MISLSKSFITNSSVTVTYIVFRKVKPAKTKTITLLDIDFDDLMRQSKLYAKEIHQYGFGKEFIVETEQPSRIIARLATENTNSDEYRNKLNALQKELEMLGYAIVDKFKVE